MTRLYNLKVNRATVLNYQLRLAKHDVRRWAARREGRKVDAQDATYQDGLPCHTLRHLLRKHHLTTITLVTESGTLVW